MTNSICDPPITEQEFVSPSASKDPAISPPLSFISSVITGIRLYLFKATVWTALSLLGLYQRSRSLNKPSFTKYYEVRPNLQCRIFLPSNTDINSTAKLPLYINIHGGGFALCSPSVDDHFASPFARTNSLLVISINYRKAPQHRFPFAVSDIVALTNAILTDPLLPIDHSKVCIGGFSAGGNLALSASLHPSLQGKISALLPIYSVVDFSGKYKGTFRHDPSGKPDILESSGAWFSWGYIPQGTDRKHPLLSPIYAPRAAFATQRMFFVGAEYDYLCAEAYAMAKMLGGRELDESEMEDEWEQQGIKWKLYRGQQHGFTHTTRSGEDEKSRKKASEELYAEMGRWLMREVWGKAQNGSKVGTGDLVEL